MPLYDTSLYVKSVMHTLAVDVTTNSTTPVTLFSGSIDTIGGSLILVSCMGNVSFTNANRAGFFRLRLDGGVVSTGWSSIFPSPNLNLGGGTVAIQYRSGVLDFGSHTIDLQWWVSTSTIRCRPVAASNQEGMSMLIQEVYS